MFVMTEVFNIVRPYVLHFEPHPTIETAVKPRQSNVRISQNINARKAVIIFHVITQKLVSQLRQSLSQTTERVCQ